MPSNKRLLILPGDGIGPEVMGQVRRVIGWFDEHQALAFDVEEDLVGGAAIDAHGVPLTEAIPVSACGTPKRSRKIAAGFPYCQRPRGT